MSGKPSESATAYDYISKVNYDYFENRTMVTYGNGVSTTYDYTKENQRLNKITTQTGSSVLRSHQYAYDKVGNITQVVNPVAAVGQIGGSFTHNYTYDNLNRLKTANGSFTASAGEQNALNDKSSAYNLTMTYDEIHRITKKEQQHTKNANNTPVFENSYSKNYNYYEGNNGLFREINENSMSYHEYDLNGNMRRETKFLNNTHIGTTNMFWDENNRLRAVKDGGLLHHYIYDATGERVLKGSSQYSAAYENGLQVKSSITFNQYVLYPSAFMVLSPTGYTKHYYNGGERVVSAIGLQDIGIYNTGNVASKGKTANSLKTAQRQDLEQLAKEAEITSVTFKEPSNNSAELEEENPIGISAKGLSVSNTANVPKVYFYHSDHLGTNSYITNASATAVQFYVNLPFGETMVEHKSMEFENDYLFTGHELDRETNLYYAHARYLNPRIGVWLSVDPLAEKYPNMSPYNYCANNPIVLKDPDGKNPILGMILGAFTEYASIVGSKMIFEKKSFSQAHRDIKKLDYANIAISGVFGAISGTGKFIKFMNSTTGKKILKELAVTGIQNFIKIGAEILVEQKDISIEEAEKLVVTTLVEVGLSKFLPKPAQKNLEEAKELVKYYKNPNYRKAKEAVATQEAAEFIQKTGETVNGTVTGVVSKGSEKVVEEINQ